MALNWKVVFTAEGTKKVALKPPILIKPSRTVLHTTGLRNALRLGAEGPWMYADVSRALPALGLYPNQKIAAPIKAMTAKPMIPPRHPNGSAMMVPNGAPITDASDAIAPRMPMARLRNSGGDTNAMDVMTQTNATRYPSSQTARAPSAHLKFEAWLSNKSPKATPNSPTVRASFSPTRFARMPAGTLTTIATRP